MTRQSSVTSKHDSAGDYEVEIFDCPNPKRVIVCAHGGGVRRWDGENFFYAVAEHYADSTVMLVDQNQQDGDSVVLSPLPVAVARIQNLITAAEHNHPTVPIIVLAHSMGTGVASFLDFSKVKAFVMVAPTEGRPAERYIKQYGPELVNGKTVLSSDGLQKTYSKEFMASIKDVSWEDAYRKLTGGSMLIYVFESGADEIIGDERFALRDIPFTKYIILEGAPHNLAGKFLEDFFTKLDPLIDPAK